jgi:hypothetical protein
MTSHKPEDIAYQKELGLAYWRRGGAGLATATSRPPSNIITAGRTASAWGEKTTAYAQ